MSGEEDW